MQFNNDRAIYLQIADYICDKVLRKEWLPFDKIPSVRELAVAIEVNPNTVARAYTYLEQHKVIQTKRGIGFFVTSEGFAKAMLFKKERFLKEELPRIFKNLDLIDLEFNDLKTLYIKHKAEMKNEKK